MSVALDAKDLNSLVDMLQANELMQDNESRRALLKRAGLERVMPLINVAGAPYVVTTNIVTFLAQFGRITYENEALGLFLNAVKPTVGIEQQDALDALLTKYKMMEPSAPPKKIADWKSTTSDQKIAEKIFGENTLRPIAFLHRGLDVARSVAYISVSDGAKRWSGTGFLIAPSIAMTNHHVVPTAELLSDVKLRFNYQEDFKGEAQPTKDYPAVPNGAFHADEGLDYSIFEVQGKPGEEWGWLPLQPRNIKLGERVNIIQHPNGQPKQISLQNNLVEYVGGNVIQYVTATNPGSSGSPVFNDGWQVVGVHHAGGNLLEPTTGKFFNRNEGILVQRILANLPADLRKQIDQAAA